MQESKEALPTAAESATIYAVVENFNQNTSLDHDQEDNSQIDTVNLHQGNNSVSYGHHASTGKNISGTPNQNNDKGELSFDSDDADPLLNKSCAMAKAALSSSKKRPRRSTPNNNNALDISKCRSSIKSYGLTNAESESILSLRHLSEGGKAMRTTDPVSSQFNMLNMYVGIALIALPKAVSEVGFIAAALGLLLVNFISLGASYFLLKARNRFKR